MTLKMDKNPMHTCLSLCKRWNTIYRIVYFRARFNAFIFPLRINNVIGDVKQIQTLFFLLVVVHHPNTIRQIKGLAPPNQPNLFSVFILSAKSLSIHSSVRLLDATLSSGTKMNIATWICEIHQYLLSVVQSENRITHSMMIFYVNSIPFTNRFTLL